MKKMEKSGSFWKFLGINVLIAVVLIILIVVITVLSLKKYTQHGVEMEVPQVTGLYLTEAEYLLNASGLKIEVIDSTFSDKVPLGTIVEQTPPAEAHVKDGRTIYVVINASTIRSITLPELHDVSYRQAQSTLRQLGLTVDSIEYEPSEYRDLVLDVRMGDQSLETGAHIELGTSLTLVVGQGRGTEMVQVPAVTGLKMVEARSLLLASHLTMGQAIYDEEPTEDNRDSYIVYMQVPQGGQMLLEGSAVTVKLSQNTEKSVTADNQENEDDFF